METQNLDAIIQKYLNGDHGPAILAHLNAAAWECFHDPWEARPAPDPVLSALAAIELPEPPPILAPRDRRFPEGPSSSLGEKLIAYLEVHRWEFTQDEGHAFTCTPTFRGMEPGDLVLRLSPDGPRPRMLRFEMASSWPVPEGAWEGASALCDTWNDSIRSLQARLERVPDGPDGNRRGALMLRDDFALPRKVTLRDLVAFLDGCVINARDFWGMARQAAGGWGK